MKWCGDHMYHVAQPCFLLDGNGAAEHGLLQSVGGGVTAKADFHSEDKHRIDTYLCQHEEEFQLWVPPVKLWVKLCGLAEWLEAHV